MTLQTILYFYDLYQFEKLMVNVKFFADSRQIHFLMDRTFPHM